MVDRERQIDALNAAFANKYQSLARYIAQASPYVAPGQEATLREIEAIAAEDEQATARLAEAIERLEGIPLASLHAPSVAELNYLSLEYLLGVLIGALQNETRQYAALAAELGDHDSAGAILLQLRAATDAQVARLRARATSPKA